MDLVDMLLGEGEEVLEDLRATLVANVKKGGQDDNLV